MSGNARDRRRAGRRHAAPEYVESPCTRCGGKGYHHGFGEHGIDPDWCLDCGGPGVVFAEARRRLAGGRGERAG